MNEKADSVLDGTCNMYACPRVICMYVCMYVYYGPYISRMSFVYKVLGTFNLWAWDEICSKANICRKHELDVDICTNCCTAVSSVVGSAQQGAAAAANEPRIYIIPLTFSTFRRWYLFPAMPPSHPCPYRCNAAVIQV